MTPEQITHKVALIKGLYADYNREVNSGTIALRIKVQSEKIYAFSFEFKPADFYCPNIGESCSRSIIGSQLQNHIQDFLPRFLYIFNNTKTNDPIATFKFAQNKEDFIHYKQTAQIQAETNERTKAFWRLYNPPKFEPNPATILSAEVRTVQKRVVDFLLSKGWTQQPQITAEQKFIRFKPPVSMGFPDTYFLHVWGKREKYYLIDPDYSQYIFKVICEIYEGEYTPEQLKEILCEPL
jgi:hypothetical protein